jgi:hypothetical protein
MSDGYHAAAALLSFPSFTCWLDRGRISIPSVSLRTRSFPSKQPLSFIACTLGPQSSHGPLVLVGHSDDFPRGSRGSTQQVCPDIRIFLFMTPK